MTSRLRGRWVYPDDRITWYLHVLNARNDRFRVDVRNALIAETVACGQRLADYGFNLAALHPAYPIKRLAG